MQESLLNNKRKDKLLYKLLNLFKGFAPKYVSGQAQITKQYGMPDDPRQTALSAGLGTFASLAPQQQAPAPTQTVNVQGQGQGQGQGQFVGFQPQGQMVPYGQMMPYRPI